MKTTQTSEGTIITVHVKPKFKNFQVKIEEDNLLVLCRNAPEKGKVNKELIKELSKLLKREIIMVSGFTSREKIILVKDTAPDELERLLHEISSPNAGGF